MKRFLPLLMFTGLLFGQEVLHLKSGESYKGTFYGKVGEDIVFKVEGETSTKKFPVNYVDSIQTKNGELTYPLDIPPKKRGESFAHIALQSYLNPNPLQSCMCVFILLMMTFISCGVSGSGCGA